MNLTTLKAIVHEIRQNGIKEAFRKYGWKFLAVIFFYYMTRDLLLYALLPWILFTLLE